MKKIAALLFVAIAGINAASASTPSCNLDGRYERTGSAGQLDRITVIGDLIIMSMHARDGRLLAPVSPRRIYAVDKSNCSFTSSIFGLDDRVPVPTHPGQWFQVDGNSINMAGFGLFQAVR